jgi:hypothetical protein
LPAEKMSQFCRTTSKNTAIIGNKHGTLLIPELPQFGQLPKTPSFDRNSNATFPLKKRAKVALFFGYYCVSVAIGVA